MHDFVPHNNSVLSSYLPTEVRQRKGGAIRIGYRRSELPIEGVRQIWVALVEVRINTGTRWNSISGGWMSALWPALKSPSASAVYISYFGYLEALKALNSIS